MRMRIALLASLALIKFAFAANAMSSMPNGEGNPYPSLLALFIVLSLFLAGYVVADRLTQRRVNNMKNDHDTDGLINALKNAWLARKAACALGDIKDDKAVGPLMDAMYDRDSDLRQAAAKALGEIGDSRAVEPLTKALDDEYRGVRDCARSALDKIRKSGGHAL
jgi:hypothetical protein